MHSLLRLAALTGGIVATVHATTPTCVATQPPASPTAVCGLRGTVNDPYWRVANPAVASSVEDCARICNGRAINSKQGQTVAQYWCRSFYYDSATNLCGIGTDDISHSVDANASSTQVFYSHRCFDCGPPCNQPFGQQLIENGGFEQSPIGPWNGLEQTGPGSNSSTSWQATPKTSSFLFQNWNQCGGYVYKFSFDYKVTPSGDVPPKIRVGSGLYTFTDQSPKGTSGQWKSITGFHKKIRYADWAEFIVGNTEDDSSKDASNTYNIDNVAVSHFPISTVETRPLTQPAFQNGGFESGRLSPWDFTVLSHAPYSIVSPGLGGTDHALFLDLSEKGTKNTDFYLSQTMQTKPNTNYMLSFDYHIQGQPVKAKNPPVALYLNYGVKPISIQVIDDWFFGLYFGQHTFRFPIGVQSAETPFTFSMGRSGYYGGDFNVTFDNFLLEEIIE